MRLSTGVLQVAVAVAFAGILAGCMAAAPPSLTSAPVAIIVSESGGVVTITATPMDAEIWWNAKTGQAGEVAWSLRLEGSAGRYVDRVEVRAKNKDAPETKLLLKDTYGLVAGGVTLSGPVQKDPGVPSTPWAYDVVALMNGAEVKRLDPRIIIRK